MNEADAPQNEFLYATVSAVVNSIAYRVRAPVAQGTLTVDVVVAEFRRQLVSVLADLHDYRGKPAADGPRYKALGNSMAVPVMSWIGQRISCVHTLRKDS